MKGYETAGACDTHAYNTLVRKPEENRVIGRPCLRLHDVLFTFYLKKLFAPQTSCKTSHDSMINE
jgi:hypothetical protein